jgi:hypothetical protein
VDCGLTPDEKKAELDRVSFIIRQMHKHRGLTIKEGGNNEEETVQEG